MSKDYWSIADIEVKPGTGSKKMDYSTYSRIQESIARNLPQVGKEESLERRKESTRQWLLSIPEKWRKFSLRNVQHSDELRKCLKKNKLHSFFVSSSVVEGLAIGYALLRVFVSNGWVFPRQIAVVSEEELSSIASGGFEGTSKMNSLLEHKVFLITVGGKPYFSEREIIVWSRLVSHCFEEDLVMILVSTESYSSFLESLPPNTSEKIEDLVGENIIGSDDVVSSASEYDVFSEES